MERRPTRWRVAALLAPWLLSCGVAVSFDEYDTRSFFAGGEVTGLDGETVALVLITSVQRAPQRAEATHLEVGNGPFAFAKALGHGTQYSVTAETNRPGLVCSVEGGKGSIDGADARVVVRCMASAARTPAELCVETINQYRAMNHLPPYARWKEMEPCADGQATSDGAAGAFRTRWKQCGEIEENECGRWPGTVDTLIPRCLGKLFDEGPGGIHYEPMMSTRFQQVWCGFGVAPDGTRWTVQNFR